MTADDVEKIFDSARELAWKHFDSHAKQRIDMFRSYLTLITIVYAGYGLTAQYKFYLLGAAFSLLSVVFSVVFYLFDLRTRQLIRISEAFLLKEEKRLSDVLNDQDIRLFRKSDLITHMRPHAVRLTYSNLFCVLFASNVVVAFVVLLLFVVYASL